MDLESGAPESMESTAPAMEGDGGAESVGSQAQGEESQAPAYQPNFKFKVKDKELEFDERLRAVIKSKEDEEFLRDLHTKAYGLEDIKAAKEARDREFQERTSEWSRKELELKRFFNLRKADLGAFLQKCGVTDDEIYQYYTTKHDPEVAQSPHFQKANQLSTEHYQLSNQYEDLTSVHQQTMQELHRIKMDLALGKPEVQEFAKLYETRVPSMKFQELVRQTGDLIYRTQGRIADPQELVQQVMATYQPLFAFQQAPQSPTTPTPVTTASAPTPPPNLGSGSQAAPVKKAIKSIDDLKRLRASMNR